MEGSPLGSRRPDEQEFNLREWHLRARISRENTDSRRYSASYIRSFREDSRSFRSNFTISSTASSPGCHLKDEIDPSTYSFTTALKALQARSGYVWDCLSPEGFSLSSKWNEAERFISNPLSGEVPMECLSAKTLSNRSFRGFMASRVTMSAPLVFSAQHQHRRTLNNSAKPPTTTVLVIKEPQATKPQFPFQEEKVMGSKTRDAGTQSTPEEQGEEEEGSSSPSPTSTPSIHERSIRRCEETEDGDTQNSSSSTKLKPVEECMMQVEVKVTREEEETKRRNKESGKKKMKKNRTGQLCSCKQSSGCLLLSWRSLWMKKRQREKHKIPPSHNQTITTIMS